MTTRWWYCIWLYD